MPRQQPNTPQAILTLSFTEPPDPPASSGSRGHVINLESTRSSSCIPPTPPWKSKHAISLQTHETLLWERARSSPKWLRLSHPDPLPFMAGAVIRHQSLRLLVSPASRVWNTSSHRTCPIQVNEALTCSPYPQPR